MSEASHLRFFPYAEPYDHQREAMGAIGAALEAGRDVLFEGACGTGKTLAALAPALEYGRRTGKTVVITTNVHQQTRQFIEEARAINASEPIRSVVFRGKASMCHIDVGYDECQALRDATKQVADLERDRVELSERAGELADEIGGDGGVVGGGGGGRGGSGDARGAAAGRSAVMDELRAVEAELDELDDRTCDHYLQNLVGDTDPFYEWLFEDVRTPDEIFAHAGEEGFCGYELLKEGMEGVDLVICNYHHLLDPMIREQFLRWLGREPDEVVAVFDEAHNVEDAARDHATRTLAEPTLDSALAELEEVADPRANEAENVVEAFLAALRQTYDDGLSFGEREGVGEDWYDLSITNDAGRDDLTLAFLEAYSGQGIHGDIDRALALGEELDRRYQEEYRAGERDTRTECRVLQAASFVDDWLRDSNEEGQYPVVSVRRDLATNDVYGRAELYTCIPRQVTAPLFEELHASVLMSATLRPFDVLADVLGIADATTLAYGEQFPEERRRTYAVDTPALFASRRDDPLVQEAVANALADAIRFTPGNTLAFFPSYREAERYHDLVAANAASGSDLARDVAAGSQIDVGADVEAELYLDRPGERADDLRERFTAGDHGALFTSLWGTLAEGVSFDDDDARTVCVVGVPYPHLDDRMDAVQDAYASAFGPGSGYDDPGWTYAVEIPTVRKTRQALGRVVRSPTDFGTRVLIDERYTSRARREMGKYSVSGSFPREERDEQIDVAPEKLRFALLNFYQDMDAFDGDSPRP